MDNVIFQIWNTLKIDTPLSSETKWRIKELFLLLVILQANQEEICVVDKLEEINKLSEQEQLLNWFYDNFVRQCQIATEDKVFGEITISPETSAEILTLIERYQTAANPLQWTNFGAQIYVESYLSQKIDLLHQIGTLVNILAPDETFDDSTRVTQKTQDVCDRVCNWVEGYLGITMKPLNIYEPFIHKYKKFTYHRSSALKEIGTRCGLLPEEPIENEDKISEIDASLVLNWLDKTHGIKLPFPDQHSLELVDNLASCVRNSKLHEGDRKDILPIDCRKSYIKTALLVASIILLIPISVLVYERIQGKIFSEPHEVLLKRKLRID